MFTSEHIDTMMYLESFLFNYKGFKNAYQQYKKDNPTWEISSSAVKKVAKICLDLKYNPTLMFPTNNGICIQYSWFTDNYTFLVENDNSAGEKDAVKFIQGSKEPVIISTSEINNYVWNTIELDVFMLVLVSNGLKIPKEQYISYVAAASNLFPAEIIQQGFKNMEEKAQYLYDKWEANLFKTKAHNMYGLSVASLVPDLLDEKQIPYYRLEQVPEDETEKHTLALAVGPLTSKEMQEIIHFDKYSEKEGE